MHVDTQDEPYTYQYKVTTIVPNEIFRLEFKLGFRVSPRINLMFKKVVEEMVANKEINIMSKYESLQRGNVVGDFQFIVMEKFLSRDNELGFFEKLILQMYFWIKNKSLSEERGFGLEQGNVTVEQFPLIVSPVSNLGLTRVYYDEKNV